ncbi:hypothetical protein [Persephonella sp. KM09-Lau-8]|uniref:hypothetical protein n=1 Tax=Persephonella sp. KM09-Lau-8 TaxID=1158345 RepID=UPI0004954A69|nr:hypothetical protein [Persephonella sp. KM09-Lau-8]
MNGGSAMLKEELSKLEQKRKTGEIGTAEFYQGLLKIVSLLAQELGKENIEEKEIKRQIPLLLTFLKSQIKNMEDRNF